MMETGEIHLSQIKGKTGVEVEIMKDGKTIGKASLILDKYDKKLVESFEGIVKLLTKAKNNVGQPINVIR